MSDRINIREFNVALVEALGLDPRKVRSVTLTATCDDLPLVTVECILVQKQEASRVTSLIRRYRLEPLPDEPKS